MSNYILLIKITEIPLISEDSIFINSFIRLFIKTIQLLTNDFLFSINYRDSIINLKEFSISLKVKI